MKQHGMDRALELASRRRDGDRGSDVWGRVLRGIQHGWDPEALEWERSIRPWQAAALAMALLAGGGVVVSWHGRHRDERPPGLTVFQVSVLHRVPAEMAQP